MPDAVSAGPYWEDLDIPDRDRRVLVDWIDLDDPVPESRDLSSLDWTLPARIARRTCEYLFMQKNSRFHEYSIKSRLNKYNHGLNSFGLLKRCLLL